MAFLKNCAFPSPHAFLQAADLFDAEHPITITIKSQEPPKGAALCSMLTPMRSSQKTSQEQQEAEQNTRENHHSPHFELQLVNDFKPKLLLSQVLDLVFAQLRPEDMLR